MFKTTEIRFISGTWMYHQTEKKKKKRILYENLSVQMKC